MLLGWKMLLRCKFCCCLQKGGWGGGGGVITSCEVRWMMLNPGRFCLVGRCCYVASFAVVYRRGVGGGVITSCEVRWMMLNPGRCCLVGRCCYVASFVVVDRRGGGGWWGGVITSCEVRWMMGALAPANCFKQPLWTWRWKRCVLNFVHGSPVHYHMFYFWTERPKWKKPHFKWLACSTHLYSSRCKIFLFQHGQTSSSSAMKMEVRMIKPFQRKT